VKFHNPGAEVFVPDQQAENVAFSRITHLGIGAHQDDLEFMAFHGIANCYGSRDEWFAGVTCTNGAGSPRKGDYAALSDAQMTALRRQEQRKAAELGRYAAIVQLDYASSVAKDPSDKRMADDLTSLLAVARPKVVYTHNLADKHDTHVAVGVRVIEAIRALPACDRPHAVYGCEVWRDLDWMPDSEKVVHDVTGHERLAAALGGAFDTQTAGGKRYDLAVEGRRRANATFFESHGVDKAEAVSFAMDLSPLALDDALDIGDYVAGYIDRFRSDVAARLSRQLGR
jgi:LmbE family N-acetylglucosaminyl deacetylase